MKRLNFEIEIQDEEDKEEQEPPYYLRNFLLVLQHSIGTLSDLFDSSEIQHFQKFQNLSSSSQRLFVRLYLRKGPWFSFAKINYFEVSDISKCANELESTNFAITLKQLTRLKASEHLDLIKLPKLIEVARLCHLNFNNSNVSKSSLIELFQQKLTSNGGLQQRTLDGKDQMISLLEKAIEMPLIRLDSKAVDSFKRAFRLFTMNPQQQGETIMILSDLQIIKYPKYIVDRNSKPFKTRDSMLKYEEACFSELELEKSIMNSDLDSCSKIIKSAFDKLTLCQRDEPELGSEIVASLILISDQCKVVSPFIPQGNSSTNSPNELKPFNILDRFTEEWVLSRLLNHGIESLEKQRFYCDAIQCCWLLLSLPFRRHNRADWWERLSLDLEHTGRHSIALLVSEFALKDSSIGFCTGGRISLQKRVLKLSKPPLRWSTPNFPSLTLREPSKIFLKAKQIGKPTTGEKSVFLDEITNKECTVEELVLLNYSRDGWNGFHSESGVFITIFSLLLWNEIFSFIPGAFLTPWQDAPLDFGTQEFYFSRKDLLEKRLLMISLMNESEISSEILKSWNEHQGMNCRGINWTHTKYTIETLQMIAQSFGGKQISQILILIAQDGTTWRAGMPDLVLFKQHSSMLTEVKGPHDRLSTRQEAWIEHLLSVGVNVELAFVNQK